MNAYYNYEIKRTCSYEKLGIVVERKEKYAVACCNCGKTWTKERMCNLIKYPERFVCTCGRKTGTLKRVK